MKNNIVVEFKDEKQHLEFPHQIKSIEVDGQKLSNVHDLTQKVVGVTKTIKVLAITATTLAVMAVATVMWMASWLLSHDSSIKTLLLTTKTSYGKAIEDAEKWNSHRRERAYIHLQEFHGLHWDEGMQDWVNHAMPNYSKRRK